MALVLAIEPDLRQAAIIKRVMRQEVHADLVLVDSRDAAMAALQSSVPDVVLLTALMSPRDEEQLISHLRSLDRAEHLQTHTIPQLASSHGDADPRAEETTTGLLGRFRRRKEAEPIPGCDPALFAVEVRAFLERAAELKAEAATAARAELARMDAAPHREEPALAAAPPVDPSSAWASPFEWRKAEPPSPSHEKHERAPQRESLVTAQPLAVLAEEEDRRRTEDELQRLRAEAEAQKRGAAEAEAETERLRAEAEAQKKAAAEEKAQLRREAEAERERLRLDAEAEAERVRARAAEAQAKAEAEARVKEEALAKERLRLRAEGEALERMRVEAEARAKAEGEARDKAEAEVKERLRAEAEALKEEARKTRERLRREADALAARVAAAGEAAQQAKRAEAARAALAAEAAEAAKRAEAAKAADRFADFREDADRDVFRLMPLAGWARRELPAPPPAAPTSNGDLHDLFARFALPPQVAGVTYPKGCRIRRVRVPQAPAARPRSPHPVILSKRTLEERRAAR